MIRKGLTTPHRLNLFFPTAEELELVIGFLEDKYPDIFGVSKKIRVHIVKQAVNYYKLQEKKMKNAKQNISEDNQQK